MLTTAGSNVPDIRLVQNNVFPNYSVTVDWLLQPNGQVDDTQALATAVIVALGTNGLASDDDVLPDPDSTDRCGWGGWGTRVDVQRIEGLIRIYRCPLREIEVRSAMLWDALLG